MYGAIWLQLQLELFGKSSATSKSEIESSLRNVLISLSRTFIFFSISPTYSWWIWRITAAGGRSPVDSRILRGIVCVANESLLTWEEAKEATSPAWIQLIQQIQLHSRHINTLVVLHPGQRYDFGLLLSHNLKVQCFIYKVYICKKSNKNC